MSGAPRASIREAQQAPIRFGTSGWRGILGDAIHARTVDAAVAGVASWLCDVAPGAEVLVAHDRRFGGRWLAERAGRGLRAVGLAPRLARGASATPVVSHAVRARGAAGALVFTASHNAPADHGLKVLDARGASAPPEVTRRIERAAAAALARPSRLPARGRASTVELMRPYRRALVGLLGDGPLRRGASRVVYDAMHGCGAGVLDTALEELGARVVRLRTEPDLRFGGGAPDPLPERLGALCARVAADDSAALGLATDGDADRYGVVDERGRPLNATQALALLVDHLARSGGLRGGVAISIATGSLVERVARHHGLPVTRHPIGFKYLSAALAAGADAAGEESGGFALAAFGADKDGMLAGALLAEVAVAGPLSRTLHALERRFGASACGRRAFPADAAGCEALARLIEAPPERVGGAPVLSVDRRDGLHLGLADGFLMLRASGTERMLRVYAEATDARRLRGRLDAGRELLARVDIPRSRSLL